VLGLSPLEAGLWSVPGALSFIIGSNLAPKLVQRVRPAYIVASGLSVAAFGMLLITQVGLDSLALIVAGNIISSVGFSFAITLTVDLVIGAAPPERAGAASALSETGAELGGALGLAILGSLGMAIYRIRLDGALPAGISPEVAHAAEETLGGAVMAAAQLPPETGAALLNSANLAFVNALQVLSIIGVGGFIVLVIMVATVLRDVQPQSGHGEEDFEAPQPVAHPQPEMQGGD
jgi:DHA2 family multidrug resistance protein-like MFS transporter